MAVYYVSPSGNDSNPGTIGSPKLTIAAGLGLVTVAGDTLYLRAGTYDEQILEASFATTGTSWASPITVAAYPSEAVTVRPTSGTGNVVGFPLATSGTISYAIFERIIFDGEACGGDGNAAVAYLESSTHHIRFDRCHFRLGAGNGVLATLGSHHLEFLDCECYSNGQYSGYLLSNGLYLECDDSLVSGGRYYDNEGFGIRVFASAGNTTGTVVERVRVYENGPGRGLGGTSTAPFGGGIIVADTNQIAKNCLVYRNAVGLVVYSNANGCELLNNTVYDNDAEGIWLQFYTSAPLERNNIAYLNGTDRVDYTNGGNSPHSSNLIGTDPSFVNAGADNFALQSGSVARNAGTTVSTVTNDFSGVGRPQESVYDIGAYEFVPAGAIAMLTGSLTLTGHAVALTNSGSRTPGTAALTAQGQYPDLLFGGLLTGTLTITGQSLALGGPALVTPPSGSLTLTGQAPTRFGPGSALGLTGRQPALLEARMGIARLGATRLGFIYPRATVHVGDVDITRYVDLSTMEVLQRTRAPHEAHFTLRGTSVADGQRVTIALANDQASLREFSGYVVRQTQRVEETQLLVDVSCQDATRILDKYLYTKTFVDTSASEIVRHIATVPGIAIGYIQPGLPKIARIDFDGVSRSAALSDVARQLTPVGEWRLDYSNTPALHFGQLGTQLPEVDPITNASVYGYVSALQVESEQTQIRTSVTVKGYRTTALLGTPGAVQAVTVTAAVEVEYWLVAGGGAGAGLLMGGGGGGGILTDTLTLGAGAYTVTIGAGGTSGNNGGNSVFWTFTAIGGGRGGTTSAPGGTGGSGGGGAFGQGRGGGTVNQGWNGGHGFSSGAGAGGGGGGGGEEGGAASVIVSGTVGGRGGAGRPSAMSGTQRYYAGGGGGNGSVASGEGGIGGGGKAGAGGNPGTAGAANTGGGGGGGGSHAGGSGICIVRYRTGAATVTGGTTTTDGVYTIHTFTSSGTLTVSDVILEDPLVGVDNIAIAERRGFVPAGDVLIGTHEVSYYVVAGATVNDGENPPGTTLTSDVGIGGTALPVVSVAVFQSSPGWVKVGDQIVRYTGQSVGPDTLVIPAAGYGSLKAPVKSGTAVTWLASMHFQNSPVVFDPPIRAGDEVVQLITLEDTDAQDALVAIGDPDGVYEYQVDDPDLSYEAALEVAASELQAGSRSVQGVRYTTRFRQRAGQHVRVTVTGALGVFEGDMLIQEVRVYGFDEVVDAKHRTRMTLPIRDVAASVVRLRQATDLL